MILILELLYEIVFCPLLNCRVIVSLYFRSYERDPSNVNNFSI